LENILKFSGWLLENIERDDFYKKELNTSFWSADGKFDQSIREKLLKIADDFYKALKINATIKDIHLTGSLANYNWTNKSDLDVHILIDFNDIDENVDLVKKALDGQRFIWNTRHKIVIRNHDVELYIQDFQEPHIASGLFSLLNNEWIKTPSYKPPSIDYRDVDKKFEGLVNDIQQIESLLNLSDFSVTTEQDLYRHALSIKDKILKMRREGLARDGEFAIENLTFKKLRNEGYIEKIIDLISKAYTKIYNE
jgi:predicted nucleotidyltransferase